ncbi:uncharacterized protein B0I36DRAFT_284281 [Microdochium trichocladiopsis]|uniref:C2H2-type domain-containing protein n=1 Tax=Microdochium trichocladiopsis TaxID=1682393 RepID=A0A9P8YFT7_9PEZI|nr:uncharacterized protein B0I36DRAFT_284281 [Microdochium trichocladiopsis]KAH7038196.1 hypothetical protein B0I36DRAFT_284281 [Microdochium trichocladiopsis]
MSSPKGISSTSPGLPPVLVISNPSPGHTATSSLNVRKTMKRKAENERSTAAALRGPKRSCIEDPDSSYPVDLLDDGDDDYVDNDDASESGSHYAATQTSTRAADTPLTPLSPARKFPSEFKTIKCTFPGCDKAYNRPARLAAHLRSHSNDRPFRCTYPDCDKSYIEEKHLKQHIKGSHTNEREHVCQEPDCGKSFLTATRLRRHQAVHEGQERFRCRDYPPCNQTFRKHQTLQRHIRSDHLKVSPFPCNYKDEETGVVCKAGFENSGALRRHQEREHGELRFWCDECSKGAAGERGSPGRAGFPSLALLQAHIKTAHVACMFCGEMCNGRESLEEHIEVQHSTQSTGGERKRVSCSWPGCKKTFAKQANLNVHVRSVHEGQRFICGQVDLSGTPDICAWPQDDGCGESFTTKANLENHVRFVHLKFQRPERERHSEASRSAANPLLDALSGSGASFRHTIACTVEGCTFKLATAGELEGHLQKEHSLFMPTMHETLESTSDQLILDATAMSPAAAAAAAINAAAHDATASLWDNEKVDLDDTFWYGGDIAGPDFATPTYDDEWMRDEAEMRQLIGDSVSTGNHSIAHNTDAGGDISALVDPALGAMQ